jgi:hypothetical protein
MKKQTTKGVLPKNAYFGQADNTGKSDVIPAQIICKKHANNL